MKNKSLLYSLLGLGAVCVLWWMVPPGSLSLKGHTISFNEDVRPILNDKCLSCHGGVRQSGGFSLLFPEEAARPNESGHPAFIPGDPEASELIRRVRHEDPEERMPLDHAALSDEEIDILSKWIAEGAAWETHWSYKKPAREKLPTVRNSRWIQNGIDNFVLDGLQKAGLTPAPQASCTTLLRRVSLDLTGLPPTPEDVDGFCNDLSSDAYEKQVDRLLDSPAYGERWAAMWLDLARYADSKGYEKDGPRTIWKYRDWVIDAFNRDLPFDQFTIEQLAGDLLPDPSEDQLIATAFHRNTMNNDEGGTDDEEFRTAAVIDRVNTTWEVWMGTTMACVQCHSHPYDPFTHQEYYEFLSFFNNTEDRDTPDEFPTLQTFADSQKVELEALMGWVSEKEGVKDNAAAPLAHRINEVLYPHKRLFAGQSDEYDRVSPSGKRIGSVKHNSYVAFEQVDLAGKDELSIRYSSASNGGYVDVHIDGLSGPRISRVFLNKTAGWGDYQIYRTSISAVEGMHTVYFKFSTVDGTDNPFNIDWFYFHDSINTLTADERAELLEKRKLLREIKPASNTPILQELAGADRRETHLLNRGNFLDPTDKVQPGVPSVMPALPEEGEANRLKLAKWIVSEENPLTARVIVNRFWEQIFGAGIIETVEDFGTQGEEASHPELLDWLALQFIHEHTWSVKSLLKQIVMSGAYQQEYDGSAQKLEIDPDNRLLSRGPRIRLSAEQIRDQTLAVSGLLSKKMFGPSVYPYQPEGIWNAPYSSMKWELSEGDDRYRRGLYTYWRRSAPYPSMIAFDSPSRELCVSRRISTNTPLQALVTLNDPAFVEAAEALALRVINENLDGLDDKLIRAFKLALVRDPKPAELNVLRELYKEAYFEFEDQHRADQMALGEGEANEVAVIHKDPETASLTVVANAILNLDEFIMKS